MLLILSEGAASGKVIGLMRANIRLKIGGKEMKTWRILFESGWEVYYEGDYCGAVNYADSCNIGLGYEYTIEEW